MSDRPFGFAVGRVDIGHAGRVPSTPGPIVPRVGPQLAGLGPPASGIEHRRRRLVGEQLLRTLELREQPLVHRAQQEGGAPNPIGQGRAIERDALPRVDLGLPVQRKVIGVFGDQHLGNRRLGRQAAFNQPRRRWRLHHDLFAGPAGIFGPAHHEHAQLRRDDVEPLAAILADAMQRIAAARTGLVFHVDRHLKRNRPITAALRAQS